MPTGPAVGAGPGRDEADEERVQQDGDPEDHAHLFGRSGPEREREEDSNYHGGGGEDDAAAVGDGADHRLAGRGYGPVFLGGREQEHRVVIEMAKIIAKKNTVPRRRGSPGLEAEQSAAVPVLEDEPGDADETAR